MLLAWYLLPLPSRAQRSPDQVVKKIDVLLPAVMKKYDIPGMSVGIVHQRNTYLLSYGYASRETKQNANASTLYELGSISKTLTASLASYAQLQGQLDWQGKISDYLPALRGTQFGEINLLHLATHTTGGLPLQLPDKLENVEQVIDYLQYWQARHVQGSYRTYSNLSAGLLGEITARSLNKDFFALMEEDLFPALGMKNTYLDVPPEQINNYAQGYTSKEGMPIRLCRGLFANEAYGVKSTVADMVIFLKAQLGIFDRENKLSPIWSKAIAQTHTPYFQLTAQHGGMAQDLIWEQYQWPVSLDNLIAGNAPEVIFDEQAVSVVKQPDQQDANIYFNKTGSTNGFGAYIAFVPAEGFGIVILANRSYPINERVRLAYAIMREVLARP